MDEVYILCHVSICAVSILIDTTCDTPPGTPSDTPGDHRLLLRIPKYFAIGIDYFATGICSTLLERALDCSTNTRLSTSTTSQT